MALGLLAGYSTGHCSLRAQNGEAVLLVANRANALSQRIADYYIAKRGIPLKNVCQLDIPSEKEEIDWDTYVEQVERPIARCLAKANLTEQVLYVVTTMGVPLKVSGGGQGLEAESCAVDSELTLLYSKMKGKHFARAGLVPNPFYRQKEQPFTHARFPIYLVTRLAGYDFDDVKGVVDRSLAARGMADGKFVFDLKSDDDAPGNDWLRTAALALPKDRVVREGRDRLRWLGIQRSQSAPAQPRISMAAWRAGHRVRFDRRPHLSAPARGLDHWHVESRCGVVRRLAADAHRRLHPRRRHRLFRPCLRAIPGVHTPPRSAIPGLLPWTQSG
jgi:uncharacterized protein (TIGR03790 family)